MRVLIVEDEPRIASFVEKGLRANGFATSVAARADEAVAQLRVGDFDIVVLDFGLRTPTASRFSRASAARARVCPL